MASHKRHDSWGWLASYAIKDKAVQKLLALKNPRYAALLLIEFFLTMLLVGGMVLYLDGRFNQLDWPLNFFVFAGICFAVFHFYNYTKFYRETRRHKIRRRTSLKTIALEIIIFLIILISGYFYYNTGANIIPFPYNFIFFLAILAVPLYFYINEKFVNYDDRF